MVDLSPNWSNVSVNDAKSIDKWQHTQTPSNYGGATSVPFVHLLGSDVLNPGQLYTCERHAAQGLPAVPPRVAPWPHRLAHRSFGLTSNGSPHRSQIGFADVAVGILVAGRSELLSPRALSHDAFNTSALRNLCLGTAGGDRTGLLLACARLTWMRAAPRLHVLALIDCRHFGPSPVDEQAAASFDAHTPFVHAPAAWLRSPSLHLRCFWGPTGKLVRGWGGHRKTAALLRALHEVMPNKRFYLKLDEDTLLRPYNLLRFLTTLDAATLRSDQPLYFGSARSRDLCTHDRCHMLLFNTQVSRLGTYRMTDGTQGFGSNETHITATVPLREEATWRAIESQFLDEIERTATSQLGLVGLAGGGYGFNRIALGKLVRAKCLHKIGELRCTGKSANGTRGWHRCKLRRGLVHTFEDNAVGLCMHLNRARPIHCEAFRSYVDSDPADFHQRWEGTKHAALARWPILLHPLKQPRLLLQWWHLLERRDAAAETDLQAWRAVAATAWAN